MRRRLSKAATAVSHIAEETNEDDKGNIDQEADEDNDSNTMSQVLKRSMRNRSGGGKTRRWSNKY
jgi:hypothetical protein